MRESDRHRSTKGQAATPPLTNSVRADVRSLQNCSANGLAGQEANRLDWQRNLPDAAFAATIATDSAAGSACET